jgi:hypothetical protein
VHTPDQESPLHEHEHIRLRAMVHFLVWFVVSVIIVHILIFVCYRVYQNQAKKQNVEITGLTETRIPPPEPRLQPSLAHDALPRIDMETLRSREMEDFKRRGWVSEGGVVTIPDDVAQRVIQLTQPTTRSSTR